MLGCFYSSAIKLRSKAMAFVRFIAKCLAKKLSLLPQKVIQTILFDKIEFPNFNFSDYFENDNFFEIFVIIVSKLNKDK